MASSQPGFSPAASAWSSLSFARLGEKSCEGTCSFQHPFGNEHEGGQLKRASTQRQCRGIGQASSEAEELPASPAQAGQCCAKARMPYLQGPHGLPLAGSLLALFLDLLVDHQVSLLMAAALRAATLARFGLLLSFAFLCRELLPSRLPKQAAISERRPEKGERAGPIPGRRTEAAATGPRPPQFPQGKQNQARLLCPPPHLLSVFNAVQSTIWPPAVLFQSKKTKYFCQDQAKAGEVTLRNSNGSLTQNWRRP